MEEKYEQKSVGSYASYGISRRNAAAWAAVLFTALSFAARIVYYSAPDGDAARIGSTLYAAFDLILTGISCLWFSLAIALRGEERLYKTGKPVLLFVAFLILRLSVIRAEDDERLLGAWHFWALIVFYLALGIIYRRFLNTGGRKIDPAPRRMLALVAFFAALLAAALELYFTETACCAGAALFESASLILASLAVFVLLIFAKRNESEHPLPMAGDRKDGRRIRSLDPMNGVAIYVMPDRTASSNLFRESFECSKAEAYIREKREAGLEHFGYTHLFLAAYARTVAQRPAINRFISGQKTYSREGVIEVSMTIKKDMSLEGSETIVTIYLSPDDTPETIYEKFNREVESVKDSGELDSSFDRIAGLFNYIPGVLLKFTVWLLKTADYFDLLPKLILKLSPFHGTIFVTSMGSLGIKPIYHHLYDFGNIPVFLAFGMKRSENELQPDGSVVKKRYMDFTLNTDERICDGFYYASAFKIFKRCLSDPARLDTPPEEIVWDQE